MYLVFWVGFVFDVLEETKFAEKYRDTTPCDFWLLFAEFCVASVVGVCGLWFGLYLVFV